MEQYCSIFLQVWGLLYRHYLYHELFFTRYIYHVRFQLVMKAKKRFGNNGEEIEV